MSARRRSASPTVLILAAGQGKRMRSARPKLLHEVGGLPVVAHVLRSARGAGASRIVAVLGVGAGEVRSALETRGAGRAGRSPAVEFCTQTRQLGTAHAVMAARRLLEDRGGTLLILNGDVPLVTSATLRALLAIHRRRKAALSFLTTLLEDPRGYGRVVRGEDGEVTEIREQADLRGRRDLASIREINAGLYCVEMEGLFEALKATSRRNAQREFYLPDLVSVLRARGRRVQALRHQNSVEVLGINTRADLAAVLNAYYRRRAEELMASGVTLVDPASTWVDAEVRVGRDTIIHPSVRIEGRTRIGPGCVLRTGVRVSGATLGEGVEILDHCLVTDATIGKGARVGPFAHLRPGTRLGPGVRIGNFVETKKASLGRGSKANHLAYLGDATIGRDVNVGAGTITCNFDGWEKHQTVLRDGVFIGSDTQLVAPVTVGRGAFVGAGSTVTRNVPADALAISRTRQQAVKGWAARKRREMAVRRGRRSGKR